MKKVNQRRKRFVKQMMAFLMLLSLGFHANAQYNKYSYLREINTVDDLWSKINIPPEVVNRLESDYLDIRIYSLSQGDTIEEPYFLDVIKSESERVVLSFEVINKVKDSEGFYYTFHSTSTENLNQIHLRFDNRNFDTKITLYGSENGKKWFVIKDNHRIISIVNNDVNYTYSSISFPDVNYQYLKVKVDGSQDLNFRSASIYYNKKESVPLNEISNQKTIKSYIKKTKKTILDWETPYSAPVSSIEILVDEELDYFRPITILYVNDSSMVQDSMIYHYQRLASGTISSLEKSVFQFPPTQLKKLKIKISNNDNQPVDVRALIVKSNSVELTTRIKNSGKHHLVYGRKSDRSPNYDVSKFKHNIPSSLKYVQLGAEFFNELSVTKETVIEPIFENKMWLWLLMGVVILVLGTFTFRMMKQEGE